MPVDLFIQGLRRSGTTFLYDVLLADPRWVGFYEPLAAADKPAVGGGSKMSEVDYFEVLRAARIRFALRSGVGDFEALNHGAPRDASLELDRDLPPVVADYVRFLCDESERTVLKFVRAWRKLPALLAVRPTARVIHIVRDPRAVVTSFLFGKGRKHAKKFERKDAFFETAETARANQGLAVADALIRRGELAIDPESPHALKILGVWREHFRSTHRDGLALGPQRYLLLRHEDLLAAPGPTLERIFAFLGDEVPAAVRAFVGEKLDPTPRVFEPEDARWRAMFDRLGLDETCAAAGYSALAAGAAR